MVGGSASSHTPPGPSTHRLQWGSTIIRQLSAERAVLYEAIEEIREGLELPGDVLGDGRVGTRDFALDPDDVP